MRIAGREIAPDRPPYIIAELGVNHDGSAETAMTLVDAAQRAGADAVKLQLFDADLLLSRAAKLAAYQKRSGADDPLEMLRRLQLTTDQMAPIIERAHRGGLHVIVSIFSLPLVEEAQRLPFDAYKTASTDIINRPLIQAMMNAGMPLILSTGAATLQEVAEAASWLGTHEHVFMHCVSAYPTPDEEAALGGRLAMLHATPHALGYSDHTTALDTGALAVASGACLLEKHFTHDRSAPGPDHTASLDEQGLKEYVRLAHRAWTMRGPIEKRVSDAERDVREASRQSLTATRDLPAGHTLTREDLAIKRPGTGISPARLGEIVGRTLACAVKANMPLNDQQIAEPDQADASKASVHVA
ncbi:MAG: N-acetylneuraminate synthase family protein [Planctomycetota bacterium]|nr:N-acetylneuraminate synthase family protein [Planctomycetota bacterium]